MITVNIRKQGTATVITIPDIVMKTLDLSAGSTLEIDISSGAFIARPVRNPARRRYSLAELLRGVTPAIPLRSIAAGELDRYAA